MLWHCLVFYHLFIPEKTKLLERTLATFNQPAEKIVASCLAIYLVKTVKKSNPLQLAQ